jgi:RHS repeat-associated protein
MLPRCLKTTIFALLLIAVCSPLNHARASCTPTINCILSGGTPPQIGPAVGEPFGDMSSGLFMYSKTDMTVAAPIPIVITRTYRSEDRNSANTFNLRDFGLGTTLNYVIYLYSAAEVTGGSDPYGSASIVLPDGGQITCSCAAGYSCSSYQTAELTCGASQPSGAWFASTLAYQSAANDWTVTRKDGTIYTFGVDAPLQSIHDRYDNSITINHVSGASGPIASITASNGRSVTFQYAGGVISSITDGIHSFTYGYNSNDALTTVTPAGFSTPTTYGYGTPSTPGDITRVTLNITGSENNINYVTYGSNLRVNSFSSNTASDGYSYNYTVTSGYVSKANIDLPDGTQRNLFFDQNGYLTEDQRAPSTLNEWTCYTRDGDERITQIVRAGNTSCPPSQGLQTTVFVYNSLGDVTSVTQTPGPQNLPSVTTSFEYQGLGTGLFDELTQATDPLNNSTNYYYDSYGSLSSVTDPMNRTTTYFSNAAGQLQYIIDPLNNKTTFGYNPSSGDLASVTDPANDETQFFTDAVGRLTSMESPLGGVSSWAYDVLDDVLSATDANGNTTISAYDNFGEITSVEDANGHITTVTRPATLNKATVCDPAGNCEVSNYDVAGKKTSFVDKRGITTAYTYDNLQRLSVANTNGAAKGGYGQDNIAYAYDNLDRQTSAQDTGNRLKNTISYTYDGVNNLLTELTAATNQGSQSAGITYTYDADSRVTKMQITPPGGGPFYPTSGYVYDNDSELTGAPNTTINYDNDGRRTSLVVAAVSTNVTTNYGYDVASRLTSQSYVAGSNSLGNLTYGYDQDSRLISEGGSLASTTLPSSEGPNTYYNTNQIETWNGAAPKTAPDNANNLTSYPAAGPANGASFTWDDRNLLFEATGGAFTSFDSYYDASMRRQQMTSAYGGTNYYADDGYDMVASDNSGGLSYFTTPPGSPEVFEFNNLTSPLVPLHDQLGSTVGLVNSSGALQTQYTYDPFGNVTTSGQSSSYPFLFAGMEYDSATSLYHTQSRYYSPGLQRFLSEDPQGFAGGDSNFFAYVGNSPANATDPLGQAWWDTNDAASSDEAGAGSDSDGGGDGGDIIGLFQSFGEWLAGFFGGGGGGSQPVYFKDLHGHHFPSCDLIGAGAGRDCCANQKDSALTETQQIAQSDENDDSAEEVEIDAQFFREVFDGQPTSTPSGGIFLRLDNGMELFLPGGLQGTPAKNGEGVIFPYGPNTIRIAGPRTTPKYDYPKGYVRVYNPLGQPLNLETMKPTGDSHYGLLGP